MNLMDEARRNYSEMDTSALLALWDKDSREAWAEALLSEELQRRGVPVADIERRAKQRGLPPVTVPSGATKSVPRPRPIAAASAAVAAPASASGPMADGRGPIFIVVFVAVFTLQVALALLLVSMAFSSEQMNGLLLLSMGLGFAPVLLALGIGLPLMGLIAMVCAKLFLRLVGFR